MKAKISDYFKNRRNSLLDDEWFDESFTRNFLYKKLEMKDVLNEKKYRLSDEEISSRVVNHWQKFELITDDRPEGKGWRKFSMSEIIWISIMVKLRNFGVELDKIKRVKKYLDLFNSPESQSKCPLLDFYILLALSADMPVKLIVFDSGESLLATQQNIDLAKQFGSIVDDYIVIDINKLVFKNLQKKNNETDYIGYNKTNIEKEVFNSVYLNNVKSITIKTNKNEEFIMDKEFILDSKKEMEMLFNKLYYADATTSMRGKKKIFKLTQKEKIKKW